MIGRERSDRGHDARGIARQQDDVLRLTAALFQDCVVADYKTPGIGVGLSISREIMIKMNGRLTVETEVGVGSTFTVWLRAA
ncbi:MAG TPA: ATP-binding protein [Anaerolineae bacterium]|nr:ATP-binding protein [Anaerolineae bacterium]